MYFDVISFRLLDPSAQNQYDVFLMSYADILFHWGYTNNSKLVLKFMTHLPEPHTGIGVYIKQMIQCNGKNHLYVISLIRGNDDL